MGSLEIKKDSGVIRLEIQKPEIHNAFDPGLIDELKTAFQQIAINARAVLLSSQGDSFCAGADLRWMKNMVNYSVEENRRDSLELFDMIHAIRTCPVPVVARVHGPAIGGGAGLVSACDIALAGPHARFGFTEVRLGLLPAIISPFVLEKIGRSAASRYFLSGETFSVTEAMRIGLINGLFESDQDLDLGVEKLLSRLVKNGPTAMRECKKMILESSGRILEERERVAGLIARQRTSEEGQEGMNAFLQKRTADFAD
ncbi:enoyl-CoA hydratase/isomerase family protein [bacterium]|jgi:methylglutaconyl-CoA hydratase|nr:enoyl-CoA hydratase/isomerase family protein [bacterium]